MQALSAAKRAFNSGRGVWPQSSSEVRVLCFQKLAAMIAEKKAELAKMITWEVAKVHERLDSFVGLGRKKERDELEGQRARETKRHREIERHRDKDREIDIGSPSGVHFSFSLLRKQRKKSIAPSVSFAVRVSSCRRVWRVSRSSLRRMTSSLRRDFGRSVWCSSLAPLTIP
jgi:hypothetical protein